MRIKGTKIKCRKPNWFVKTYPNGTSRLLLYHIKDNKLIYPPPNRIF